MFLVIFHCLQGRHSVGWQYGGLQQTDTDKNENSGTWPRFEGGSYVVQSIGPIAIAERYIQSIESIAAVERYVERAATDRAAIDIDIVIVEYYWYYWDSKKPLEWLQSLRDYVSGRCAELDPLLEWVEAQTEPITDQVMMGIGAGGTLPLIDAAPSVTRWLVSSGPCSTHWCRTRR